MGRGSKRPRRAPKKPPRSRDDDDVFADANVDDEIDAFHKQRDVIPLDVNAADTDSDDDGEQPVFNLEGGYGSDTESGSSDDDDVMQDAIPHNKFAAKIARQAKYLKQKFGGADDEMHDDDEEEEEKKAAWGRRKHSYYGADNVDYELQSSDEDLPKEEEAEVLKMQQEKAKFLTLEDFGIEESDQDESNWDIEGKKMLKDSLDGKEARTKAKVDGLLGDNDLGKFEEIKKDISALSVEEQMDAVYSSAPELVDLLSELNDAHRQLQILKPAVCEVRERKNATKGRMDYLEVKQVILLSYCQAIVFCLLLKSEGHSVQDHPVAGRLAEIKALMEKMKQIDSNLPSQIGETVGQNGVVEFTDKLDGEGIPLDPEPEISKISTKTNVKEVADLMNDGSLKDNDNKQFTKKDHIYQGATNDLVGFQSMEMLKVRANLEAKLKQKGYDFTNSSTKRPHNHGLNPINRHLEAFADFDDEVQTVVSNQTKKLSQLARKKKDKAKLVSGDDDLPKRDDIGERRRKHELRVLARAGAVPTDDDIEDEVDAEPADIGVQENDEITDSEDDFYKEVKRQRVEKLSAKAELYARTPTVPSPLETEADGKRQITQQMEKNRGLTRHRKKLTKNPRKKYKIKHQKAVIRRKGQVRDLRKPTGPYGGEATGINASISRSIRFKS